MSEGDPKKRDGEKDPGASSGSGWMTGKDGDISPGINPPDTGAPPSAPGGTPPAPPGGGPPPTGGTPPPSGPPPPSGGPPPSSPPPPSPPPSGSGTPPPPKPPGTTPPPPAPPPAGGTPPPPPPSGGGTPPPPAKPPASTLPKHTKVVGVTGYSASSEKAYWGTTKKTGDEVTYASGGYVKKQLSALEAYYNVDEKKAALNLIKGEGQFSCGHAEWDIWDSVKGLLGWKQDPPPPPPAPGTPGTGGPFAARLTDLTTHTPPLNPGPGSPNVLIGNLPAWRTVVDSHVCLQCGGVVVMGAPTVLINNQMACRVGDVVVEPCAPNPIALGCPTVLIGVMGPPPSGSTAVPEKKPWIDLVVKATGDVGEVKGEGMVGAEGDLTSKSGFVGVKGGVLAAALRGDLTLGIKVRIPFTNHYLTVGVKGEGMVAAAGAEGGGYIMINQKDPATGKNVLAKGEYGGKVGAGWLGGGLTGFFTIMP